MCFNNAEGIRLMSDTIQTPYWETIVARINENFKNVGDTFEDWRSFYEIEITHILPDLELMVHLYQKQATWDIMWIKLKNDRELKAYWCLAAATSMGVEPQFSGSFAAPDCLTVIDQRLQSILNHSEYRRNYLNEALHTTRSQPPEGHPQDGPTVADFA